MASLSHKTTGGAGHDQTAVIPTRGTSRPRVEDIYRHGGEQVEVDLAAGAQRNQQVQGGGCCGGRLTDSHLVAGEVAA